MKLNSTAFRIAAAAMILGMGVAGAYVAATPSPSEQVIKVTARRFTYTPNEIRLKKGVPVILEFTTEDVLMGFSVPDLGVRADIVPGQVTRVRIVPDKTGTFIFLCDIFCGSGHENMNGIFVVSE